MIAQAINDKSCKIMHFLFESEKTCNEVNSFLLETLLNLIIGHVKISSIPIFFRNMFCFFPKNIILVSNENKNNKSVLEMQMRSNHIFYFKLIKHSLLFQQQNECFLFHLKIKKLSNRMENRNQM